MNDEICLGLVVITGVECLCLVGAVAGIKRFQLTNISYSKMVEARSAGGLE